MHQELLILFQISRFDCGSTSWSHIQYRN